MTKCQYVLLAVSLLLVVSLAGNVYQFYQPKPIKTDTITVSKVEIQEKIRYKTLIRVDTIRDTIRLVDSDTVINVPIPITQNVYIDTFITDSSKLILGAKYSGYKPSLDSLWYNHQYSPIKAKNKPFKQFIGVGIGVGYGGCVNPSTRAVTLEPYVGIHLTYGWGYTW